MTNGRKSFEIIGTTYKGKSVFSYGDISTTSFHATKVFHTIEGGAVFTNDPALLKKIAFMRNFGHDGPENFAELGINGKNSEFHAAMGLVNLKYIDQVLVSRAEQSAYYEEKLANLRYFKPDVLEYAKSNCSYFPIKLLDQEVLHRVMSLLERAKIYPRRYFYPLLSVLPYVKPKNLPFAEEIAKTVLCLPLYHGLSKEKIDYIIRILLRAQNYES